MNSDLDKYFQKFNKYMNFTETDIQNIQWNCTTEHILSKWRSEKGQPICFINRLDSCNQGSLAHYIGVPHESFFNILNFFRGIYSYFHYGSPQEIWGEDMAEKYWQSFDALGRDGLRFYSALRDLDRKSLIDWYDKQVSTYGPVN